MSDAENGPTPAGADAGSTKPPAERRKVFVVDAENYSDYESLKNSVGKEPDVEVVLDRRARRRRGLFRRAVTPRREERREQDVSRDLRAKGWAVVKPEQTKDDREDGTMKRIVDHLKDEQGIETLEWIAIGALILSVAIVIYPGTLQQGLVNVISSVSTALSTL